MPYLTKSCFLVDGITETEEKDLPKNFTGLLIVHNPTTMSRCFKHFIDGSLSREGDASITWNICPNEEWYQDGKLHRLDGPAVIKPGIEEYWIYGTQLSIVEFNNKVEELRTIISNALPTCYTGIIKVYSNNSKDYHYTWFRNGELNRTEGPSMVTQKGTKKWYKNNQLHREDGPAIQWAFGGEEYWLNGIQYSFSDYKKALESLSPV